ncbi:hypothetical protein [Clostridium sp.]|uniref:hypothetical protein n=1 Tax=Clostridium sp. TaxID=1506 RepID=UPI002636DC51|nr:hypothetical protein [Clostridium sp.]
MLNMKLGIYRYIGSGSSRKVFDLGNGYVVKVAKNNAGFAQNKMEYKISSTDTSNLFANVIQASDDFYALVMQKADKINNFSYVSDYFKVRNIAEVLRLKEFQDIYYKYNLLLNDLRTINNWGIINGRPVIIDYGFTKEIRERYYSFH